MTARHEEPSLLMSLDDEPYQPSRRLLARALEVAKLTFEMMLDPIVHHPLLSSRPGTGPRWYEAQTGDHYHLLKAACRVLKPKVVWEFGTGDGMSAVAMLEGYADAQIYTVDTVDRATWIDRWDPIIRITGDMANPGLFSKFYGHVAASINGMRDADLIFVDGPKDGFTETKFCGLLDAVKFARPPIVIFDDIRLMNMVHVWRAIAHPKLDVTSFGHWSGTGMVEWV